MFVLGIEAYIGSWIWCCHPYGLGEDLFSRFEINDSCGNWVWDREQRVSEESRCVAIPGTDEDYWSAFHRSCRKKFLRWWYNCDCLTNWKRSHDVHYSKLSLLGKIDRSLFAYWPLPCIILCSSLVSLNNRVLPFYRFCLLPFFFYTSTVDVFTSVVVRIAIYVTLFISSCQAWSLTRWWAPIGSVPENLCRCWSLVQMSLVFYNFRVREENKVCESILSMFVLYKYLTKRYSFEYFSRFVWYVLACCLLCIICSWIPTLSFFGLLFCFC